MSVNFHHAVFSLLGFWPLKMGRIGCPKMSGITTLCCIICQKSADLTWWFGDAGFGLGLHGLVQCFICEFNTLRTGDANLRFYITTAQDRWRKSAFLTRACFPCTIHLIMQYMEPVSEWSCRRMFIETWPHSKLNPGNVHFNNLKARPQCVKMTSHI